METAVKEGKAGGEPSPHPSTPQKNRGLHTADAFSCKKDPFRSAGSHQFTILFLKKICLALGGETQNDLVPVRIISCRFSNQEDPPFSPERKGRGSPSFPPSSFLAGSKSSSRLPHAAAVVDQSLNEEEEELQFRRLSRTFSEGIFVGKDSPSGFRMRRGRKEEEENKSPLFYFFR